MEDLLHAIFSRIGDIRLEWWILYLILAMGFFFVFALWGIIRVSDQRLELLFRGEDILHRDLEEIKNLVRNMN